MRAVVYARYSSDLQSDRSIEDQERVCREYAQRLPDAKVIGLYADRAISGASIKNRPEVAKLLADARAGHFDIVIVDALDRLSRDMEDLAHVHKRLDFLGVKLHSVADGLVADIHVGVKGMLGSMFLKNLAANVKRGKTGRVLSGYSAGGRCYGYRNIAKLDADQRPILGLREIEPTEAAVIRRIFDDYLRGKSPRAIAAALNKEGVPAPYGGLWNGVVINGQKKRGYGILYNPLYVGKVVYNRTHNIKNPDTGKRLIRMNPERDWIVREKPELRIIRQDVWDAAQRLKREYSSLAPQGARRPRHLFSGLCRCGVCGGSYTVKSRQQLGCSGHYQKGNAVCENGHIIRFPDLERRVLEGLKDKMLSKERMADFARAYQEERKRLAGDRHAEIDRLERKAATLDRQIGNIVDAVAEGAASLALKKKLAALEDEKATIEPQLVSLRRENKVIDFHPSKIESYRKAIENLQHALAMDETERLETVAILRRVVDAVEIYPGGKRGDVEIKVRGVLSEIFNLASGLKGESRLTLQRKGREFGSIIEDRSPVSDSSHCAAVAASEKPDQARRYPARNTAVGT